MQQSCLLPKWLLLLHIIPAYGKWWENHGTWMITNFPLSSVTEGTAIFNKKYSAVYKNTKYFLDNLNFLGVREICHYTQLFTCKIPSLELLLFMQYLQTSTITKHETYFNDDPVHQSRYHISLHISFQNIMWPKIWMCNRCRNLCNNPTF